MDTKKQAQKVLRELKQLYSDLKTPLHHDSPFQLLMAVMLSAQCTDALVNKVTPALFKAYPTPMALAQAVIGDVENRIRRVNYYKTKARHLIGMAKLLVADYNGKVPDSMDALIRLPGVGRKTANVILGAAFDRPVGIVVDTHVKRLANRLGLTAHQNPVKIERELMQIVPKKEWENFSLALIFHGRACCTARNPDHKNCPLADMCPSATI